MRIISGSYRGKIIHAPANLPVRPTTDYAKTALFNILQFKIDFNTVRLLDLFAGTGNISYEFYSRGCRDITCIDTDQWCVKFIKETFPKLKFDKARVYKADVFNFLKSHSEKYDIIFADPPFEMDRTVAIPDLVLGNKLLNPDGWLIVEHSSSYPLKFSFTPDDFRKYGHVSFSIFRKPME